MEPVSTPATRGMREGADTAISRWYLYQKLASVIAMKIFLSYQIAKVEQERHYFLHASVPHNEQNRPSRCASASSKIS